MRICRNSCFPNKQDFRFCVERKRKNEGKVVMKIAHMTYTIARFLNSQI